ncbi:MAG: alpha-L-arabinofuranosidase, partial [Segetibacter sp.]|nr:alpha-L-arabinofuranosidase [Segetibacter sp.]
MINRQVIVFLVLIIGMLSAGKSNAQAVNVITVKANEVKANIKPTMYGIFFEDINFGADGGLYAELVKNRSFEFYNPLMGWREVKEQGSSGKLFFV